VGSDGFASIKLVRATFVIEIGEAWMKLSYRVVVPLPERLEDLGCEGEMAVCGTPVVGLDGECNSLEVWELVHVVLPRWKVSTMMLDLRSLEERVTSSYVEVDSWTSSEFLYKGAGPSEVGDLFDFVTSFVTGCGMIGNLISVSGPMVEVSSDVVRSGISDVGMRGLSIGASKTRPRESNASP
jgi:hypothetical protein